MKILFLTDNFPPEVNATASRVYERARYWSSWGHNVTIITSAPNFPQGRVYPGYKNRWYHVENMQDIKVVRVKTFIMPNQGTFFRIIDFLSFFVSSFFAGLYQSRPDVVVATSPQFFTAVSGWGVAFFHRVPFIFEVADLWPASLEAVGVMRKSRWIPWLERIELFLYKRASRIVVLTDAFKKNLIMRKVPANKIHVIINGVELSNFYPIPASPHLIQTYHLQGKRVIGYIGTFGLAQGLLNVLHTAMLLKHDPSIVFLMVGDGAEKTLLQKKIAEWNIDNVILVPAQPKATIIQYWALCDLALVHLKKDILFSTVIPSKLFEAMAMRAPIVLVAPEGEALNILHASQTGVWVPPEDPEALKKTIELLLKNEEAQKHYKSQSEKHVVYYTRKVQAERWMSVFYEMKLPQ